MKDYPNLVELWSTIDAVAERCTKCRARWLTIFSAEAGEFGGVRRRLKTTEDGILFWPSKLCDDCAEINETLDILEEE